MTMSNAMNSGVGERISSTRSKSWLGGAIWLAGFAAIALLVFDVFATTPSPPADDPVEIESLDASFVLPPIPDSTESTETPKAFAE